MKKPPKTPKPISWWHPLKEYKTKPKLIKKYRWKGFLVKVYESRYARI